MKAVRKFNLDKATKNTGKYQEVSIGGSAEVIGQLYVQKSAFEGGALPQEITVTIEA